MEKTTAKKTRATGPKKAAPKKPTRGVPVKKAEATKATAQKASAIVDDADASSAASRRIDGRIAELGDWRGEMLDRLRGLIKEVDPQVLEEWKWRGVPVWSHAGIVCTGETYKEVVKVTFAKGAHLEDPTGMFNSSLEGNTRRAIDWRKGDPLDARAFKALVRGAIALNEAKPRR